MDIKQAFAKAAFATSAATSASLPVDVGIEIAFARRSNALPNSVLLDAFCLIVESAFCNADTFIPFLVMPFAVHTHSSYNFDLLLAHCYYSIN